MADQIEQPVAAPAGAPVVAAAPEPAAVAAAPGPTATPEPVASPAPVVETPPAPAAGAEPAAAAEVPASEPTLLEQHDAKAAEKKAEPAKDPAAPAEAAKPVEAAKPEGEPAPVAELPKIDYFAPETGIKLPDTIKMDDGQRTQFVEAVDAFRKNPTGASLQPLIDMHNQAMTNFAEETLRNQRSAFYDTRKGWRDKVKADEVLGGAGYETAMASVAAVRDMLVPEKDRKAFNEFLQVTGAGDNPEFLRMMHAGARFFKEASVPPPNPQPPADIGKAPKGQGKGKGLYTNTDFKQ